MAQKHSKTSTRAFQENEDLQCSDITAPYRCNMGDFGFDMDETGHVIGFDTTLLHSNEWKKDFQEWCDFVKNEFDFLDDGGIKRRGAIAGTNSTTNMDHSKRKAKFNARRNSTITIEGGEKLKPMQSSLSHAPSDENSYTSSANITRVSTMGSKNTSERKDKSPGSTIKSPSQTSIDRRRNRSRLGIKSCKSNGYIGPESPTPISLKKNISCQSTGAISKGKSYSNKDNHDDQSSFDVRVKGSSLSHLLRTFDGPLPPGSIPVTSSSSRSSRSINNEKRLFRTGFKTDIEGKKQKKNALKGAGKNLCVPNLTTTPKSSTSFVQQMHTGIDKMSAGSRKRTLYVGDMPGMVSSSNDSCCSEERIRRWPALFRKCVISKNRGKNS